MKITVKKGLDINIKGASEKIMGEANDSKLFALKPTDFPNLVPKMLVKEGDAVKCGSPIFVTNIMIKLIFPLLQVERFKKL